MRLGVGDAPGKGTAAVGEITAIGELVGEARGAAQRVHTTAGKIRSWGVLGVVGAGGLIGLVGAGVLLLMQGAATGLGAVIGPAAAQAVVGGLVLAVCGGGAAYAARKWWPKN